VFTFEPGMIIWTLVAFSLAMIVLAKYVIPPLVRIVHDRRNRIAHDLESASSEARKAEEITASLNRRLTALELDRERILSEARETAHSRYEALEREMLEKIALMRKQREAEMARETEHFLASVDDRINRLIILGCEKVLRTRLTPEQQAEILENRIREFEKLTKI
jgi:F-type H+-transporting ATPase subunit b